MVEDRNVEEQMGAFSKTIDPELLLLIPPQRAALNLSSCIA